jgi:hypothetical protein
MIPPSTGARISTCGGCTSMYLALRPSNRRICTVPWLSGLQREATRLRECSAQSQEKSIGSQPHAPLPFFGPSDLWVGCTLDVIFWSLHPLQSTLLFSRLYHLECCLGCSALNYFIGVFESHLQLVDEQLQSVQKRCQKLRTVHRVSPCAR